MNVFLDTEFTGLLDPQLISLGMASEYGEDFYAEVPYSDKACSPFVREAVLPLLGKLPHSFFTKDQLCFECIKWLEIVRRDGEDVFICVDYQTDWDLFSDVLDYRVPPWCHRKMVRQNLSELMLCEFFQKNSLPRHHSLYDAKANCYAYRPLRAILTLEEDTFIARLSDGQTLRETDADTLAHKLHELGLTADDVQTMDWREGDQALLRGQIIAIKARMRKRQRQQQDRADVAAGRKTQEDLFLIPADMIRNCKIEYKS
jgi:hypothetical protein